jgi:hypothetical protein
MLFLFTKYSMVKNKYLISQSSQFYNYSKLHPKGVLIAEAVARFLYGLRLAYGRLCRRRSVNAALHEKDLGRQAVHEKGPLVCGKFILREIIVQQILN